MQKIIDGRNSELHAIRYESYGASHRNHPRMLGRTTPSFGEFRPISNSCLLTMSINSAE
jgi:hypothetical protein